MIRRIRTRIVRWRLRRHGRELMIRYSRAVAALDCPIPLAETVCPSLKHYRRRAKACAHTIRRLA